MKIRLLILASLLLLQCANAPTQPSGPESISTLPAEIEAITVLRVGSTTPLSAELSGDGKPEIFHPADAIGATPSHGAAEGGPFDVRTMKVEPPHPASPRPTDHAEQAVSYDWRVSDGRISGQGPFVTYTAPDHPDTVRVEVVITEKDGTSRTGTTSIIVFKQWVILKADDLRYASVGTVSPGWRRFIDFIKERKIRASVGIIGNEIERGGPAYATWIHDLAADPRFELWNHGYDHLLNFQDSAGRTVSEFSGTSYEQQLDHLKRTQSLARERCGVVLHTFGAPGNAFDSNTARALDACDDLRIWLFGATYSDKFVLPHTINIEQPIFQPNEAAFTVAYDPVPAYVTYQIHPKDWDLDRFGAFTRIIDFLIAQNVTFTTPSDFERISSSMAEGR